MLGADDHLYVVKFQNNPQTIRVLANEFLATKLASATGLSVPECEVVEVTPWLVETTAELKVKLAHSVEACRPGLQFGSQYVGGLLPGMVMDYLPEAQLMETKNLHEFAGMLVMDKWTCNVNGRQAVFCARAGEAIQRRVCGPGILLQCRGLGVAGCATAGCVSSQRGLCARDRMGKFRAVVVAGGGDGCFRGVGAREQDPPGMVRRGPGGHGAGWWNDCLRHAS